ncbi:MAG: hypothetical protein JRJ56_08830, partial [Deltaproteobacteria bacterium]|nr:hypothetical protein [Deltaproteobacteria bacterium]
MKISGKHFFGCCRLLLIWVLLLTLLALPGATFAGPLDRPALMMPLAAKSLVLDLANAGRRIVAVGWRGHILISDDDARSWHQVAVPVRYMLTGVYFADENRGWAVGHGAVILGTEDGGRHWRLLNTAPEEERPLFDVIVTGDLGFAVGAYAKFMTTTDGGKSWSPAEFVIEKKPGHISGNAKDEEEMPFDYHLNGIARGPNGVFYIAGEAGLLFRSDNNGRSWQELPSPYEGSFFGILPL